MNSEEAQFEALKKEILGKMLTKSALERLGRVKLSNPLMATKLEFYLLQLYQTGKFNERIDDKKLKQILNILIPPKKKTRIKRK